MGRFERPRLRALNAVNSDQDPGSEEDTMSDRPAYRYVTYIEANPERVWEALTDEDLTARTGVIATSPTGSRGRAGSTTASTARGSPTWSARSSTQTPPQAGHDVRRARAKAPGGPTIVTFEIEPYHEIIRLTVTHENLASQDALDAIRRGWPAVFANLKSLLETGHVLPRAPWEMYASLRAARWPATTNPDF